MDLRLLLLAWAVAAAVMLVLWAVQRRTRNANAVDVAWAALIGVNALFFAALSEGDLVRRVLIALLAAGWSLRLAGYLFVTRVLREAPEDGRYRTLRGEWGQGKFFVFYQAQALLTVVLAVPFLLISANPAPAFSWLEGLGAALWLVALAGEAVADAQLARFRGDPAHRGRTCRVGLWRYSRHPNYFFEWLIWCAYWLFALASPWGWATVYCPLLMLYFLFRVTGIPATEAQALRSKGEAYREYQRTTSVFIPWFRRAAPVTRSRA
jgi:steroid 5-alpha reductase family enzyme